MSRLSYLRPIKEIGPGRWLDLGELGEAEQNAAIERAEIMGYSEESSMPMEALYTHRIRVNRWSHGHYLAVIRAGGRV